VTARLDRFPDADAEDLRRCDGVCIICREEMAGAGSNKRLHCGHVFHLHCLRSWLERQQNCPTCRASVFRRPGAAPAAAARQAADAAPAAAGAEVAPARADGARAAAADVADALVRPIEPNAAAAAAAAVLRHRHAPPAGAAEAAGAPPHAGGGGGGSQRRSAEAAAAPGGAAGGGAGGGRPDAALQGAMQVRAARGRGKAIAKGSREEGGRGDWRGFL
ncbi:E3 ubiquitin-protein ligase, partial [Tetrabaena socialis]